MGDGNVINGTQQIALNFNEDSFVIVQHAYASSGTYSVLANVTNGTFNDVQNISIKVA